jgi:hypothetical protein
MNVFKDRKAESNKPFVSLYRGWRFRRVNRANHVMDAASQQIVFVSKMHIKRRTAHIGAIENLLDDDCVVGLFANQGTEGLM